MTPISINVDMALSSSWAMTDRAVNITPGEADSEVITVSAADEAMLDPERIAGIIKCS
jgi:hypothetical protein